MSSVTFDQRCSFVTARLAVESWKDQISTQSGLGTLASEIASILTPNVAKALPKGWQGVETMDDALDWIGKRTEEGHVFTIRLTGTREFVGLLLVNVSPHPNEEGLQLRIGYFLSESNWGQGLGSELIEGLISWSDEAGDVHEVLGLVEANNIASAKVLTRNGFKSTGPSGPEKMITYSRTF